MPTSQNGKKQPKREGHAAKCEICRKPIWVLPWQARAGRQRFCSNECKAIGHRTAAPLDRHSIMLSPKHIAMVSKLGPVDNQPDGKRGVLSKTVRLALDVLQVLTEPAMGEAMEPETIENVARQLIELCDDDNYAPNVLLNVDALQTALRSAEVVGEGE